MFKTLDKMVAKNPFEAQDGRTELQNRIEQLLILPRLRGNLRRKRGILRAVLSLTSNQPS
jgi:hypothetical protein